MFNPIRIASIVLLFGCLVGCHAKQTRAFVGTGLPGTSALRGRVTLDARVPIIGAILTLRGEKLSGTRTAETDLEGYYYFAAIPAANDYTMTIEALGFGAQSRGRFRILPWATMTINFQFAEGADYVTGYEQPSMIDYSSTSGGAVFVHNPSTDEFGPP